MQVSTRRCHHLHLGPGHQLADRGRLSGGAGAGDGCRGGGRHRVCGDLRHHLSLGI